MLLEIFFAMMLSIVGDIYSKEANMSPRIYNGEGANIEEFPHTAILHYKCRQICGGAIISMDIVVTAAHCLGSVSDPNYLIVTVGTTECRKLINKQFVKRMVLHPNYNRINDDWNDIALIRLKAPFDFSTRTIQPIKLAKPAFNIAEGTAVTIAGCGYLDNTNETIMYATRLMKTNMFIENCTGKTYDKSVFCLRGHDAGGCRGDSGSGFVIDGRLVAIDSRGVRICSREFRDVATKISLYTKWIQDSIKKMDGVPATVSDY